MCLYFGTLGPNKVDLLVVTLVCNDGTGKQTDPNSFLGVLIYLNRKADSRYKEVAVEGQQEPETPKNACDAKIAEFCQSFEANRSSFVS